MKTLPAAAAGMWAVFAGGELGTDAAARQLAGEIAARWPDAAAQVQAARRFHAAAARQAAAAGTGCVIFAAAGFPVIAEGTCPLHADAAAAAPGTRFCYADPREEALLLNRACYGSELISAVRGTITCPREIIAAAGFTAPLHAQIQLVLTWIPDGQARDIIAGWAEAVGPGGSLALSVSLHGARPPLEGLPPPQGHTAARVTSWLTGAGLAVAEPGVVPVTTWPFGLPVSRRVPRLCGVTARRPR